MSNAEIARIIKRLEQADKVVTQAIIASKKQLGRARIMQSKNFLECCKED
jgi:hypothetical protein